MRFNPDTNRGIKLEDIARQCDDAIKRAKVRELKEYFYLNTSFEGKQT